MTMGVAVMVLTLALFTPVVHAGEKAAVAHAQAAAKAWLALSDAGKYAECWDEAATFLKAAVMKADWERTVKAVRARLGAVKSRKLQSATFTRILPGAPDGEYVVIRYATKFEHKALAVETVTPMHDQDGSWRVSGYYIK